MSAEGDDADFLTRGPRPFCMKPRRGTLGDMPTLPCHSERSEESAFSPEVEC
jgi:hypothetical protein